MAQILQIGSGVVEVDQHFRGAQTRPRHQVVDGQTVIVDAGTPAPPDIVRVGSAYYYCGNPLVPVTDSAHVQHLPPKRLAEALTFIGAQADHPAKAIHPTAALRTARHRRGKGKKARSKPIVLGRHSGARAEDKNEEDFQKLAGGTTVSRAQARIEEDQAARGQARGR